jgi:hypothetical protein
MTEEPSIAGILQAAIALEAAGPPRRLDER